MKKTIQLLFLLILIALSSRAQKADYHVIPRPLNVDVDTSEVFIIKDGMNICITNGNAQTKRIAQFLHQYTEELTGIHLTIDENEHEGGIYLMKTLAHDVLDHSNEIKNASYEITVDQGGIRLKAPTDEGLFRAVQTLRKSMPIAKGKFNSVEFPFVVIKDKPRFAYRGVHLDSSRHFWSVNTIKRYIDLMALHGCNQFHWHITDDQGWRFEVKALPELAEKGSVREQTVLGRNSGVYDGQPYGGYYTQDECREIVRYAAERHINVIPEIDLPGHMQAALHVYPNLGCTGGPYPVWQMWGVSDDVLCVGNPETMMFLKTVLGEICDVFPSKFIHIGGDECPKGRWKECGKCKAKAQELALVDNGIHSVENQLQSWINREMEQFLDERGRSIIGWDETLEGGLAENATVMSWRGTQGGIDAARQHHNVIMAPVDYCYIDYYQVKNNWNEPIAIGGYVPTSKTYSFEPVPQQLSEEEEKYILGPQVNLWCEYIACEPHLFYMLLPRLDAISEVQWTQPDKKNFDDFKQRLGHMFSLYDKLSINYCHTVE